jgi:hypothetical protein
MSPRRLSLRWAVAGTPRETVPRPAAAIATAVTGSHRVSLARKRGLLNALGAWARTAYETLAGRGITSARLGRAEPVQTHRLTKPLSRWARIPSGRASSGRRRSQSPDTLRSPLPVNPEISRAPTTSRRFRSHRPPTRTWWIWPLVRPRLVTQMSRWVAALAAITLSRDRGRATPSACNEREGSPRRSAPTPRTGCSFSGRYSRGQTQLRHQLDWHDRSLDGGWATTTYSDCGEVPKYLRCHALPGPDGA